MLVLVHRGPRDWCYKALLDFDETNRCYSFQPDTGPRWVIPQAKFDEAVQTYMNQYRVSKERATEIALELSQWHQDSSGVFYRI